MLILAATLFFWTPAVFGYGIWMAILHKRFRFSGTFDVLGEVIGGMFLLSTLINIVHFFHRIDGGISFALGALGWILLGLRVHLAKERIKFRSAGLMALWLLFLAFWATQSPRNPDAALYHLQAIKWMNQNQLPLGLANLHDRLGFNSTWFSFAGALRIPGITQEGGNALSVSAILTFFLGVAAFPSIKKLKERNEPLVHDFFLSFVPLITFSDLMRRSVSSPAPDYAVMIICIAMIYFALRVIATSKDWPYTVLQLAIIVVFAVTIKPTAIPLAFVPVSLGFFSIKNKIPVEWKRVMLYALLSCSIPILVWLARGIVLSGHLNFPNAQTALPLMWTVPRPIADHQWFANQTTSKLTYPEDLPFSKWIGPWLADAGRSSDVIVCILLISAGLILIVAVRRSPARNMRWVLIPLFLAIVFWFFIGPAVRFGAGYLWGIALVVISMALSGFSAAAASRWMVLVAMMCLASFFPRMHSINFGLPPVRKVFRNPRQFFLSLPIPQAHTKTVLTANGVPVYVPADGTFDCWLSDLPCAPGISRNLVAIRKPDGTFKMFYMGENPRQ